MRQNLPVSQRAFEFPEGQTLVSVTDPKGRIVYCNGSFVEVSGYSPEELMGQPHNLVRHPDMPEEAFRDMWATIQAGQPWSGLVKNRRKNGDHYWVRANATPIRDGDRTCGFLSVRTRPSVEEVQAAEALYARMREQASNGRLVHALRQGRVWRQDLAGYLGRALRPGPLAQLVLLQLASAAAVAGVASVAGSVAGLAAAAVAAALAGTAAWLLLQRPLEQLIGIANRLASGDLTCAVDSNAPGVIGQLQRALAQLSVNLRTAVLDTRQGIGSVQWAAQEIAAGNADLSSRTEAQASNLQQTAASLEEITATVANSAQAAVEANELAQRTEQVAGRSHEAVAAVAEAMGQITDSSRRIHEIVHVIDAVAFQTNMLALNAAVEAARAGDAGRGFAVVASEVRALSARTTGAAREIKQLIEESSSRVEQGNARSADALQRMKEALTAVVGVRSGLEMISSAAQQQRAAITQINAAVTHMDSLTQQNAAMVEELAGAAQSLRGQVDTVNDSMRLFRLQPGERSLADEDAVQMRREQKAAPPKPGTANAASSRRRPASAAAPAEATPA